MADSIMRMAGRDTVAGTAKALSVETDGNGNGVLRTVDAAPWAYDSSTGRIKVQGKDTEVITLFDSTNGTIRDFTTVSAGKAFADLKGYKSIDVYVENTLNKNMFLGIATANGNPFLVLNTDGTYAQFATTSFATTDNLRWKIPTLSFGLLSNFQITDNSQTRKEIKNPLFYKDNWVVNGIRFYVRAVDTTAGQEPTSGVFKLYIVGYPN